jgi:hypothetical protein
MITKQIKGRTFVGVHMSVARVIAFALVVFAMSFTVTLPVRAASPGGTGLIANVPFEFYCGDKLFPAGEYNIEDAMTAAAFISIQSAGGKTRGWFLGVPEASATGGKPSLLFTRYPDGKNYLREVRNPFFSSSYLPKSRIERESTTMLIGTVKPLAVTLLARVR